MAILVSVLQHRISSVTLFHTLCECITWGYSRFWQSRTWFCSHYPIFFTSIGQIPATLKSNIKSNCIFFFLEKKELFQRICSVNYRTWCKTSDGLYSGVVVLLNRNQLCQETPFINYPIIMLRLSPNDKS